MDEVVAWLGFAGAWLLVAGPLFQGAIELREEDLDREGFQAAVAGIPRPDPPSRWWWLLPPAMYLLRKRQNDAYRTATFARLTERQREQFVGFMNKATGWFTVSGGALLLAAKETWDLVETHHWPGYLFGVLMVVLLGASIANTAVRMIRGEMMRHPERAPEHRGRRGSGRPR